MSSKSVLIVEDEATARTNLARAFAREGWLVTEAATADMALMHAGALATFDGVVLDLFIDERMIGREFLSRAHEGAGPLPPILVVSGRLDAHLWALLEPYRIQGFLPKPVDMFVLVQILEAFRTGSETALINIPGLRPEETLKLDVVESGGNRTYLYRRRTEPDVLELSNVVPVDRPLVDEVKRREEALLAYFRSRAKRTCGPERDEPVLVVGRRWNSWYPSYFDVDGGAYAVVGARPADGRTRGTLVDPGFRALKVLEDLDVPVGSLPSAVVTHNHPDHVAGIFEYVAARHVVGDRTALFCAPPAHALLRSLAGGGLDVAEFDGQDVDIAGPYTAANGSTRRLRATPVKTSHLNIGQVGGTRAVLIASQVGREEGRFQTLASCLLLGDTEYQSAKNDPNFAMFEAIRTIFQRPDLKVAVLHLGGSQMKAGTGKHLYLPGIIELLRDADQLRRTTLPAGAESRLLVLISEWGLEHAGARQLAGAIPGGLDQTLEQAFGDDNLIIKTVRTLRGWRFDTLTVLPADIGLTVGLESGKVYLAGKAVAPEDVKVKPDTRGLVYYTDASLVAEQDEG